MPHSVPSTIVVTGANGFLGRAVSAHLARGGHHVRQLVRRQDHGLSGDVRVVPSLHDRSALRAVLAGADAVVHLAARVHVMRDDAGDPLAEFRRANVEATRILAEEAVATELRRFVLISSVKAVGEGNTEPWDEDVTAAPVDPYGVSKLEAERALLAVAGEGRLEASILRLPMAYGPGMKGNMLRLFGAVRRGIPLPFSAVRNSRSMVYSGNVAEAVECVLASGRAAGETFFVSDGDDRSTPALLADVGRAVGRRPRLLSVPVPLLRAAGMLGDIASALRPLPFGTDMVQRLTGSLTVDVDKLRRLTGYGPSTSFAEAIRRTGEWYMYERGEPGAATFPA